VFKDLIFKSSSVISEEYKKELQLEVTRFNINRDRFLAASLVLLSLLALSFQVVNALKIGKDILYYLLFICAYIFMIIIGALFLAFTSGKKAPVVSKYKLQKNLHILLNTIVLSFCSVISIYAASLNQLPLTYVIAAFSIGTLETLDSKERRVIYLVPYSVYFLGMLFVPKNAYMFFKDTLYFTVITIFAFVIASMNYSSYVKNFTNNKIILKKNEELHQLQKTTEEVLKRRTEELNRTVEYEKLRTAFFANISHELRTPLNLIFSAEQLLELITRSTPIPGKQKEVCQYMGIMKQNCYRLIRLIANLIDTTKIDAGYFNVELRNCNIVKVVEDITLSAAHYIEGRNIDLIFDTESEEVVIACDPDKVERIILNLLSNAVKFTPSGGKIEVNILERENKLIIIVKDTGMGVPIEMQDSIFERFVQVDKSISRSKEGSGIGLSIVRSLVEMHGGSIKLISEVDKGSEFIVEMPKRIITEEQLTSGSNLVEGDHRIEKVNIEFSDIYEA
jgi:two-component system, OmpR family, phosphate regulon sensor histidine kinase PhoR